MVSVNFKKYFFSVLQIPLIRQNCFQEFEKFFDIIHHLNPMFKNVSGASNIEINLEFKFLKSRSIKLITNSVC